MVDHRYPREMASTQRRDFIRQTNAARRAIERASAPRRQLEALGGKRYLDQVERARRQVEGPATHVFDAADRAQRIVEGPGKNIQWFIDNTLNVTEGPANHALEAIGRARKVAEGPARGLEEVLERARLVIEGPAQQAHKHYERLSRLLAGYDFQRVVHEAASVSARVEQALKESLPANWRSLSLDEAGQVEELVRTEGVPLVWVPGPTLTAKLVEAQTREDAMKVLLAGQDAVLIDIEDVLREVTAPSLMFLVSMAVKAIGALRDGHPEAAQALAAAVFTSAIHDGLQHEELRDIREAAKANDPDQATFAEYRSALVVQLAARYVQGREWVKPGFNRSDTLHRVRESQFTPENSLAAVMAAAGLLREAQARYEENKVRTSSA